MFILVLIQKVLIHMLTEIETTIQHNFIQLAFLVLKNMLLVEHKIMDHQLEMTLAFGEIG